MSANLTDQDCADLAHFLREAIEADRFFPRSKKVRRLNELLAKIDPAALPVTPFPAPRPPDEVSHVLVKERPTTRPVRPPRATG